MCNCFVQDKRQTLNSDIMRRIKWRRLPGAFAKPRRLQVQRSKDGLYFCPIDFCDHNGFLSQRGCRKHTKTKHGWYFYFDKKRKTGDDPIKAKSKEFCSPDRRQKQQRIPSFSTSTIVAAEFQHWLQSTAARGGGGNSTLIRRVCATGFLNLSPCSGVGKPKKDALLWSYRSF